MTPSSAAQRDSARFRVLLRLRGWTQAEAARQFHVSAPMICYAAAGDWPAPPHVLDWLEARALGMACQPEPPRWKAPR